MKIRNKLGIGRQTEQLGLEIGQRIQHQSCITCFDAV